jgi:6-pyruvoyltetrahydropterin/6-carboxytetrahydropterin synthase
MFSLTVQREFCAAHALAIGDIRETVHGHNFRLTVRVDGPQLDTDGLLMDFHALERLVDAIIAPMQNANLNEIQPFATSGAIPGRNPSAENIARTIAEDLLRRLPEILTPARYPDVLSLPRLHSVNITEAPGCSATYLPE